MAKAVRSQSELFKANGPGPWWMDAHCFFPLLFGPLAFVVTIFPAVESLLQGFPTNPNSVFLKGMGRFVLFSGIGYVLGLGVHWLCRLMRRSEKTGIDVTVGDERQDEKPEPVRPESISVVIPVQVDFLEPGMKLGEAVLNEEGQQLALQGALLTLDMLEKIKKAGLSGVKVEGVKYAIPEIENAVEELL